MIEGAIGTAATLYSVLLIETNAFPIARHSDPEKNKSFELYVFSL